MGNPQEKHYRNIQVAKLAIERLHDYSSKQEEFGFPVVSESEKEKIKQIFLLINELAEPPFHLHDSTKAEGDYSRFMKSIIET
jgi:hypothetical protein